MKPEIINNVEQGSEEWLKLRIGSVGGTAINDIMPEGKARETLLYRMSGEIVSGSAYEFKKTAAMQYGTEMESEARSTYEFITGETIEACAMMRQGENKHFSPDGYMLDNILEIKCFYPANMARYLDKRKIVEIKYRRQVQWGLYISGFEKCAFFVYHPTMPYLLLEIGRDESMIKEMASKADRFVDDMLQLVEKIKGEK